MAKAKKKAKKATAKKTKKAVKSVKTKSALKKRKTIKKVTKKKNVKKERLKKIAKQVVAKTKPAAKPGTRNETIIDVKPISLPKPIEPSKPIKEKKYKEETLDDRELLQDNEGYSWEKSSFGDMRTYEPAPVFRKPDPPQPKFKGKKDNRTRYSDKELQEFKEIILEKIKEAERDYELLKNTLAHRDEQGTDDTSPTFKVLEDGSEAMSREEVAQLASRQEKYIQNLKNALVRIENKTYGICRVTGKLIPKERLRSVPHATLSIEAKLVQNQ